MQKKLALVAAVAGVLAAPVASADVSIYGLLDVGVQRVDPGSGYTGSEIHVGDFMGAGGSRLGFSANEDLGGGLRALATMEMGWNTDTGVLDNTADQVFQRQVFAGLAGGFGQVTVGRQYRETFLAGAAGSYNYTGSGVGVFFLNTNTGVRQNNLIKYTSPKIGGGLNVVFSYAPGEGTTAATEDDDKFQELALKWSGGPLSVAAAFGTATPTTNNDVDIMVLGGQFAVSPALSVYALYSSTEHDSSANAANRTAMSLGAKFRVGDGDIVGTFGQSEDDRAGAASADSTLIGIGYYHWLSKTTNLFVTYGDVSNDSGAQLGAPRQVVGTLAAGDDPSVLAVGWVHRF
jgi:predicted porin